MDGKTNVNVEVPDEIWDRVKVIAINKGISRSAALLAALREYADRWGKRK
jgi:post-segregation antitoxin (ccd killing protein)